MTTKSNKSNKPAVNAATAVASALPREGHVNIERRAVEADGAAQDALLNALEFSMRNGAATVQELEAAGRPHTSAKVYASHRTQCAKLAESIGVDRAVKVIRDPSLRKVTGMRSAYDAAIEAVRAALSALKASAVTGKATASQASAIVKALPQTLAARHANRDQKPATAPRGATGAQAHKMAETAAKTAVSKSWQEGAAAARLISNTLAGAAVPEGMEGQARAFLKALGDAVEAGQPFLRKVVK